MNWQLFKDILSIDSTSGKERDMALWLNDHLEAPSKELMEVGDGTLNLFLKWGTPSVVFCSHMDTVPPYIKPVILSEVEKSHRIITGRGSCDAKGQIFAMYTACKELEAKGCTDFGLLILAGEETGSWGAKAFSKTGFEAPFLIVGEPTDNKMVSAAKGTLSYDLKFTGEAFHSGYPQYGTSAVELFNQFYNALKAVEWGLDPELGETTWNIGLLSSPNPQNILSPELTCRLYFRTTFLSHQAVQTWMAGASAPLLTVTPRGGDTPSRYVTLPGFPSGPVAFGSDAPHLTGFGHKIICGPGSIKVAHRDNENVLAADLEAAVEQYVRMAAALQGLD
ncbi:MAG: M20/M25/M40 family metallo-hydrolase [Bacteroidales bacterium]|nr:M20/M25/M40 family metallo-hydrolase [Bacteroidales bacterium]